MTNSEIRRKAVSEDEDAYLVEAMLPLYAEIRELKGTFGSLNIGNSSI